MRIFSYLFVSKRLRVVSLRRNLTKQPHTMKQQQRDEQHGVYDKPQSELLDRGIFWFYERAIKYVPIAIMLAHWYGTWDFHHSPREVLLDVTENRGCIAFIYCMTYILPVITMLPASYFYRMCWIYRIPYVYLVGVTIIRLFYHRWLITSDMMEVNYFLILLTIILYIYGIGAIIARPLRGCCIPNKKR